ncbi:MAG: hypothetical protein D3924_07905, partial [Candidatus Electrothrix sp. AR4]|nr:hypothetical protein [Candidatus Electrothrix sp. AR4]
VAAADRLVDRCADLRFRFADSWCICSAAMRIGRKCAILIRRAGLASEPTAYSGVGRGDPTAPGKSKQCAAA